MDQPNKPVIPPVRPAGSVPPRHPQIDASATWHEMIDQKIAEAVAEVNQAAEAQMKSMFKEAFNAGKVKGKDEAAYEYAAFEEAGEPDFEEWFAAAVERWRNA